MPSQRHLPLLVIVLCTCAFAVFRPIPRVSCPQADLTKGGELLFAAIAHEARCWSDTADTARLRPDALEAAVRDVVESWLNDDRCTLGLDHFSAVPGQIELDEDGVATFPLAISVRPDRHSGTTTGTLDARVDLSLNDPQRTAGIEPADLPPVDSLPRNISFVTRKRATGGDSIHFGGICEVLVAEQLVSL